MPAGTNTNGRIYPRGVTIGMRYGSPEIYRPRLRGAVRSFEGSRYSTLIE